MADSNKPSLLQFLPFTSTIDHGFWHSFTKLKLETLKLSEEVVFIQGHYSNGDRPGLPMRLSVEHSAFNSVQAKASTNSFVAHGNIQNLNTVESFKEADKQGLLKTAGQKVWSAILSGQALKDPSLLCQFFSLSFADLKKYNYFYWFCYPALVPPTPVSVETIQKVQDAWTEERQREFLKASDEFQERHGSSSGFFLVKCCPNERILLSPLQEFDSFYDKEDKVLLGFSDPCTRESNPGWPLRNFLALAGKAWGERMKAVDVLCYRDASQAGLRSMAHSLLLTAASLPAFEGDNLPKVVGWEKNDHDKLAPRFVNLRATMDPVRLAESAVDLNLKLMRWRLMPQLDLDVIKNAKCLLLGAGTLGCNVARGLLGWGVKTITFVDNGRVSYSNPVRQTLFSFEDSHDGGRRKAEAAADALKRIFPGVESRGVVLSIPMPGHAIGSEPAALEETRAAVAQLEGLIKEHDVVFLLLDTRESRWLPTVMCLVHSKICVNAALGFDTYMVMRHAYHPQQAPPPAEKPASKVSIPGNEIGCYFCSDVVAPTNSTRDRTLDQQCTVSRPGTSMTAAALAVETMATLLQHPQRGLAPALLVDPDEVDSSSPVFSCLGVVPHQIRGFLSYFSSVLPASQAFDQCTACSAIILDSYRNEGFDFLLKVFNNSDFLEQTTGLDMLFKSTDDIDIMILDDDEEF